MSTRSTLFLCSMLDINQEFSFNLNKTNCYASISMQVLPYLNPTNTMEEVSPFLIYYTVMVSFHLSFTFKLQSLHNKHNEAWVWGIYIMWANCFYSNHISFQHCLWIRAKMGIVSMATRSISWWSTCQQKKHALMFSLPMLGFHTINNRKLKCWTWTDFGVTSPDMV